MSTPEINEKLAKYNINDNSKYLCYLYSAFKGEGNTMSCMLVKKSYLKELTEVCDGYVTANYTVRLRRVSLTVEMSRMI